jgi:hypothetical protein
LGTGSWDLGAGATSPAAGRRAPSDG